MTKKITAKVLENKMPKTIVVAIDRVVKHPKYHKILRRTTKLFARNDLENIQIGDQVAIVQTKPYSKNTNFKVIEKLKK